MGACAHRDGSRMMAVTPRRRAGGGPPIIPILDAHHLPRLIMAPPVGERRSGPAWW